MRLQVVHGGRWHGVVVYVVGRYRDDVDSVVLVELGVLDVEVFEDGEVVLGDFVPLDSLRVESAIGGALVHLSDGHLVFSAQGAGLASLV